MTEFDPAEFQARYGYSPQEYVNRCAVSLLHPDPRRYDVHADNGAPWIKEQGLKDDETRRLKAVAVARGEASVDTLWPYLGREASFLKHAAEGLIDDGEIVAALKRAEVIP